MLIEIGLIHIYLAQSKYDQAAYMGYIFAANFFGALIAAYGIYRRQLFGWILGGIIAIGSIAGYVWSRTLGMPGMRVEEWLNPFGIVAVSIEGLFILLLLFRPWRTPVGEILPPDIAKVRYVLPVVGLLMIVSISTLAYRWDAAFNQAFGYHIGTLKQVISTPLTSNSDLQQKYGIQVIQAATSMMGGIVDVRIRILDTNKAHVTLLNQAALLVNQQELVLSPHMHSHTLSRMKVGSIYFLFFPTQQLIHSGSEINLVFGPIRTAPVIVK